MKDATLIADLVRAGLTAELVGRVVNEITASMSGTNVRDSIRTYETLRKRNQRKTGGKQTMSAPIARVIVPEIVPDNAKDRPSLSSLLPSLATDQGSKKVVVERRRGTSLPIDWRLPQIERALAIELGMADVEITEFETEFRDYWIAIPGARGRKCDWPATARNRLREISKRRRKSVNGHRTIVTAADDLIARAEADERGFSSDGAIDVEFSRIEGR